MGGLVLHCHSRLPASRRAAEPASTAFTPLFGSSPSPDLTAAQPQGRFRALGPGFWRSGPLPVRLESAPATRSQALLATFRAREIPTPAPGQVGALRPLPGVQPGRQVPPAQLGPVAESGPSGWPELENVALDAPQTTARGLARLLE